MCPSTHTDETDRLVDSLVCVAVSFQVLVRTLAVSDCSAVFDIFTKKQPLTCWRFCPENGGMFFRTRAPHRQTPTSLHSVAPIVLVPTELAVVDFDSLVGAPNLLRM